MNCVNPERTIWRCLACGEGAYRLYPATIRISQEIGMIFHWLGVLGMVVGAVFILLVAVVFGLLGSLALHRFMHDVQGMPLL